MKLVEVVRGAKTADDVLATGMSIARTIGKVPVVARVCYGFIGNRMLIPRQDNAYAMLLEGATPEQIDRVHTDFGMPMRSEEHTSELQSLMRISYAVFCLKKKNKQQTKQTKLKQQQNV